MSSIIEFIKEHKPLLIDCKIREGSVDKYIKYLTNLTVDDPRVEPWAETLRNSIHTLKKLQSMMPESYWKKRDMSLPEFRRRSEIIKGIQAAWLARPKALSDTRNKGDSCKENHA